MLWFGACIFGCLQNSGVFTSVLWLEQDGESTQVGMMVPCWQNYLKLDAEATLTEKGPTWFKEISKLYKNFLFHRLLVYNVVRQFKMNLSQCKTNFL